MLTGDKFETSKSIGFSCGILNNNQKYLQVKETTKNDIYEKLSEHLKFTE